MKLATVAAYILRIILDDGTLLDERTNLAWCDRSVRVGHLTNCVWQEEQPLRSGASDFLGDSFRDDFLRMVEAAGRGIFPDADQESAAVGIDKGRDRLSHGVSTRGWIDLSRPRVTPIPGRLELAERVHSSGEEISKLDIGEQRRPHEIAASAALRERAAILAAFV